MSSSQINERGDRTVSENAAILISRRTRRLVDAVFPFPNPEAQHFAQHADICGDDREEVLIWNEKEIRIYRNTEESPDATIPKIRRQTKRLYKYTHYIGMP